jgi:protein-disulfide isomerase
MKLKSALLLSSIFLTTVAVNSNTVQAASKSSEELIKEQNKAQDKEEQRIKEVIKKNHALLYSKNTPFIGNEKGKAIAVVFMDPLCGACRSFHKVLESYLGEKKNFKILIKEYPIFGEKSEMLVRANLAAMKQGKYEEFSQAILKTSGEVSIRQLMGIATALNMNSDQLHQDMSSPEMDKALNETKKLASSENLNITGTPTFIVGDVLFVGGVDKSTFETIVEQLTDG